MKNQQRKELSEGLNKLTSEKRSELYGIAEQVAKNKKITASEYVYKELYVNKKSTYYVGWLK